MDYLVLISDEQTKITIMEGGRVNTHGLRILLRNMTSLDMKGRDRFITTLQEMGICTYICDKDSSKQYNVSAMKL